MSEEKTYPALEKASIPELRLRLSILTDIIKEAQEKGDLRWEGLIEDQAAINAELVKKIKAQRSLDGELEPTAIRVGVQPARMRAVRAGI